MNWPLDIIKPRNRFAEPAATLLNVERWRGYSQERTTHQKRQDAEYAAAAEREDSERGRNAAKARWAKRRATAKRGKGGTQMMRSPETGTAGQPAASPDNQSPRDAIAEAAAKLSAQADRCMRAAQALTRTALRLATIDQPTKVLQALALYQQANFPEPELAAEVSALIEGTRPPEWRAARAKRHRANDRYRLERDLSGAEQAMELPDWGREMVVRVAREKCDVLGAAADAIERGSDRDGEILYALTAYMTGRNGIDALRHWLERAGIEPGSNVVPLFRGGRK